MNIKKPSKQNKMKEIETNNLTWFTPKSQNMLNTVYSNWLSYLVYIGCVKSKQILIWFIYLLRSKTEKTWKMSIKWPQKTKSIISWHYSTLFAVFWLLTRYLIHNQCKSVGLVWQDSVPNSETNIKFFSNNIFQLINLPKLNTNMDVIQLWLF